jgi:phospholipase C
MDLDEFRGEHLTRRQLMERVGMVGVGAFVSQSALAWMAGPSWASVIEQAARTRPAGSDLEAVEHIVFLMLENRSYDHYFGAYPRGRGFDDHPGHSLGVFAQDYPAGSNVVPKHKLLPFHLSGNHGLESTDDLTHDWGPMHECWNDGKMDSWVNVHTQKQWEGPKGALTMGYYERPELPFHWALADHFTLGDAYHCSILGPTHPNRLMANAARVADQVPDVGREPVRPNGDHLPRDHRQRPAVLHGVAAARHAAVREGVQADVPERLRGRR